MEIIDSYWLYTAAASIVVFFLSIISVGALADKAPDWLVFSSGIIVVAISAPTVFYIMGYFEIYPNKLQSNSSITTFSEELTALQEKQQSLKAALQSPENLTLSQLSQVTQDALTISTEISSRAKNQEQYIAALKIEVDKEKSKAKEAIDLARKVQTITKEQLEAVKFLITEDAKKESEISFYYGLFLSFPVGFLASLLASYAWRRFMPAAKREIEREVSR